MRVNLSSPTPPMHHLSPKKLYQSKESFFSALRNRKKKILLAGFNERTGWNTLKTLHENGVSCVIYDKNWGEEKKKLAQTIDDCWGTNDFKELMPLLATDAQNKNAIGEIIISPAVPRKLPFFQYCEQKKISVWSDIDFFFPLYCKSKIIAVTGTNGKSSTVSLIHHLLKPLRSCILAGNIGIPVAACLDEMMKSEVIILEISSYMLENIKLFTPNVFVITNLEQDHLNRYENLERYYQTKTKILHRLQKKDCFVWNVDDPKLTELNPKKHLKRGVSFLNIGQKKKKDGKKVAWLEKNKIYWKNISGKIGHIKDQRKDLGLFMANENLLCAIASLVCMVELKNEYVEEQLKSFPLLQHRMQIVAHSQNKDIIFINDSKATTPKSVEHALSFLSEKNDIFLILGGKNKGLTFDICLEKYKNSLNPLVIYGEAAREISGQLNQKDSSWAQKIIMKKSLKEAVKIAFEQAKMSREKSKNAQSVVLLSPGCASFDQFADFEERGKVFSDYAKELVKNRS